MSAPDPARSLVVGGRPLAPPAGLDVRSFHDQDIHRFAGRDRSGRAVTEVVVHESVTRSAEATVRVLVRRGLGVHLVVAPDGRVTQHGDLAHDRLAHAAGHNGPSVGIEVVSPYYPAYLRDGLPWRRTLEAPWAHRGRYVLPTPEQAEALARLVGWLTSPEAEGLAIPRRWVGLDGTRLAMGRVEGADRCRPAASTPTTTSGTPTAPGSCSTPGCAWRRGFRPAPPTRRRPGAPRAPAAGWTSRT